MFSFLFSFFFFSSFFLFFFFFFQAEDGIRDLYVTGVQTCALPISGRAKAQQRRDQADAAGRDTSDLDELTSDLDEQITRSGMRGNVLPKRTQRRYRSTRRRQDAPDLPRRPVYPRTIGKTYTSPGGKD